MIYIYINNNNKICIYIIQHLQPGEQRGVYQSIYLSQITPSKKNTALTGLYVNQHLSRLTNSKTRGSPKGPASQRRRWCWMLSPPILRYIGGHQRCEHRYRQSGGQPRKHRWQVRRHRCGSVGRCSLSSGCLHIYIYIFLQE